METAKPSDDLHIRLSKSLKERVARYAEKEGLSLSEAARDLIEKNLISRETRQLDEHPQSAVVYEKIDRLREELDRLDRFMREVARTSLGTEIVLAHWATVAGGGRGGADEDRILEEIRKAGEQELRGFLEKECPGLLERLEASRKKPAVH